MYSTLRDLEFGECVQMCDPELLSAKDNSHRDNFRKFTNINDFYVFPSQQQLLGGFMILMCVLKNDQIVCKILHFLWCESAVRRTILLR
jgi:hypothetical protein